jgi:predicted polyphosphate/ATP-dependent NAD kinase
MPRTPAKVTQADVARVLRAVEQTGVDVVVEVLPDGTIRISRKSSEPPKLDNKREFAL